MVKVQYLKDEWHGENESKNRIFIPSSMGHVKSRVNQRGPPRKAKYSWVTDSEEVPRGKGEKEPHTGE